MDVCRWVHVTWAMQQKVHPPPDERTMNMNNSSKHLLILLLTVALWPGIAAAQGDAAAAPLNAHMKRYGSGWECDRGYREVNAACAAVEVPENAYLADSSYGLGWECDRGYRQANEACTLIDVPPNAFQRAGLGMRSRPRPSRPDMRRNRTARTRVSDGLLLRPRLGVRSRLSRN